MGWFKKLVKGLRVQISKNSLGVEWSSGKSFDPRNQKRTTPSEDFNKAKEEKTYNKEEEDEIT